MGTEIFSQVLFQIMEFQLINSLLITAMVTEKLKS